MTESFPQLTEISDESIKILLVEDDETDARLVKIYAGAIPNAQIVIDWVKSTAEARERLEESDYDLCIFDFWLRTHTSLPLLQDLRAVQETLPIIILSHMTNQHMLEQSVSSGAFYILGKDELNVNTLASAIDALVFGEGTGRVRLPPAPRQPAQYDPAARDIAVKLVKVMDGMRDVYRIHRPDIDGEAPLPSQLEDLRNEVSILRLEWQANLQKDFARASKINSDIHDVADLIAHAITAMTPILARQDQHWHFVPEQTSIFEKCDPVNTVLMIMEQIYAISNISPVESVLKLELQKVSGRSCIAVSSEVPPPEDWRKLKLPAFFQEFIGVKGFTFETDANEKGFARARLLFPRLLN